MQAYYEMNIEVPQNHLVSFYLPETIPAGQVKIAVIFDNSQNHSTTPKKWNAFFASQSVFADDFLAERDNDLPQERESYIW